MAGHNPWSKAKRFTGVSDAKRGKLSAKLSRGTAVAAWLAGGSSAHNFDTAEAAGTALPRL
jgi:transcriptional/translational regulatory protein YebC/TACO1